MSNFETLNKINVNEHTEEKNRLTYLSWTWAWAEFKKVCPEATYEVVKFDDGKPYFYDENTGYMVYTKVTVDGLTHEMWLPVMDYNNNAMKNHAYKVKTKFKEMEVQPATMFDINKAIMRCLTKNLAMFGLGLYIYAGEDLPEEEKEVLAEQEKAKKKAEKKENAKKEQVPIEKIKEEDMVLLDNLISTYGVNKAALLGFYKVDSLNNLTVAQYKHCRGSLEAKYGKIEQ